MTLNLQKKKTGKYNNCNNCNHYITTKQRPEVLANQRSSGADYWSTNALLKGSVFKSVMPRNCYQTILRFLHFADNSQFDPNDPDRDRLGHLWIT